MLGKFFLKFIQDPYQYVAVSSDVELAVFGGKEFNNEVFKEVHNLIDTHVQKYIDSLESIFCGSFFVLYILL